MTEASKRPRKSEVPPWYRPWRWFAALGLAVLLALLLPVLFPFFDWLSPWPSALGALAWGLATGALSSPFARRTREAAGRTAAAVGWGVLRSVWWPDRRYWDAVEKVYGSGVKDAKADFAKWFSLLLLMVVGVPVLTGLAPLAVGEPIARQVSPIFFVAWLGFHVTGVSLPLHLWYRSLPD